MANENQITRGDIVKSILVARDRAVLLDVELAALYGVNTGALNQAIKRNLERFPADFAFRLTTKEALAMVLRSARAIQMSIHVVRAFAHLRSAAQANEQLMKQLLNLEERVGRHDADIAAILIAMRELVRPARTPSRGIGFLADL